MQIEETLKKIQEQIDAQAHIIAEENKKLTEIDLRKTMGKSLPMDNVEKHAAIQAIKNAKQAIIELNKDKANLTNADKKDSLDVKIQKEQEIIKSLVEKYHIGYLIQENKFIYCKDMSEKGNDNICNPRFEMIDANKVGRMFNKFAGSLLTLGQAEMRNELTDYVQTLNRDFLITTCSFNKSKWDKVDIYNKASVITKFWVQPDFDGMQNYDKRFDFLFNCIGGGKQENINHLEQWIAFKYLNPDKVANTPNLDIGGNPGGNGKGRYAELMKTIFTNPCMQPAAYKELMDGFNANWEMAIVLHYDEPKENELPEGKLKNATGSEDLRIEKKGIDATVADRNYNILFTSNNQNGVVKLAGTGIGGEDRRYSVMTTNLVMIDEAMKQGFAKDIMEAKVFVNSINTLIKNRSEVGKWLAHIIMKHDVASMDVLSPLHGQDYKARFGDQKSNKDLIFDFMISVLQKNSCLPWEVLKHTVITLTGFKNYKDASLKNDWKLYLEKNKIEYEYLEGNARPRIEYNFKSNIVATKQATSYVIANSSDRDFDISTVLFKKPVDLKNLEILLSFPENIIYNKD
jgi:hypothetical protein